MQRVIPGIDPEFQPMEDNLRDTFLTTIFKENTNYIPRRSFTSLPVYQDGIALPKPTHTFGDN